jgi:ATP-dependent DNA ligase
VLAIVDGRRVRLQSRQQRPLARFFPEIVDALREWFVGEVVLDGVIWGQQRRV